MSDTSSVDLKPNSRSSSVMSVEDDIYTETKKRRVNNSYSSYSADSSPCVSSTSSVVDIPSFARSQPMVIDLTQPETPTQSMQELTITDKKPSRQALFMEQMRRRQEMKERQKLELSQKKLEECKAKEELSRQLKQQHEQFMSSQKKVLQESLVLLKQSNEVQRKKEQKKIKAMQDMLKQTNPEKVQIKKKASEEKIMKSQEKESQEEPAREYLEKRRQEEEAKKRLFTQQYEERLELEKKRQQEESQRLEEIRKQQVQYRLEEAQKRERLKLEEEARRQEELKKEQERLRLEEERMMREKAKQEEEELRQSKIESKYFALQQKLNEQKRLEQEKFRREEEERLRKEQEERLKREEEERLKREEEERLRKEQEDEVIVDEEMTNRNVCIGMIKTEIVTLRPLNLTKDDFFELVQVIPEGRRHNDNYSFAVTSRTAPIQSLGWIPFSDTKVLGPLVDYQMVWWDAIIPRNKVTSMRTPLYIVIYCRPHHVKVIAQYFQERRMYLSEPPFYNPQCRYSNPHMRLNQPEQQTIRSTEYYYGGRPTTGINDQQTQRDIQQLLESIPSDVPMKTKRRKKKPVIILDSDEDDFKQGSIEEGQEQEEGDGEDDGYIEGLTVQLMEHQVQGVNWMIDRENNEKSQGGILADDMGLGKTIQTIGLIASTRVPDEKRITLIITPLALIQQWADEIRSKTDKGAFKVLVHHGPSRTRDVNTFYDYDIVITTYQVVSGDMPTNPKDEEVKITSEYGPLFQMKWYRVVLDEAQQIKNKSTRSSVSCSTLISKKRWCLTGTPIQNNVDELYSLFRFLKIQPLNNYSMFRKTISIPIQNGQSSLAMNRLKAVLMATMLRRTKDILKEKPRLELPKREKKDILLEFSDSERRLYNLLKQKTQNSVRELLSHGQSAYLNMLCLLLRLRQACDHPNLILKSMNDKDMMDILNEQDIANSSSCELCGNSMESSCSYYCLPCQSQINDIGIFKSSTKIDKMLDILNKTRETNPNEKTIIFSQFTSMLDLLNEPLTRHGFKYCRYDGSMSSQERERSLLALKYDPKCTVMLISLKCGSLGLNLTAANRVILMDIWWNPALEEQAIDRVHRIGQRLPVYVTRLMIDNTVEEKIIQLQEKKALLSKGALGDGIVKNNKLSVSEMRS
ncbi:hypothetical protein CU097_000405, partial [Rhizopus azygosporus]